MWQAFDRFVAESMSGHDLMYKLALRQMETSGGAREMKRGAISALREQIVEPPGISDADDVIRRIAVQPEGE